MSVSFSQIFSMRLESRLPASAGLLLSSSPEKKFVFLDPIRKILGRDANWFSLGDIPISWANLCDQGGGRVIGGFGSSPLEHVSSMERVEQFPKSGGHSQVITNVIHNEN